MLELLRRQLADLLAKRAAAEERLDTIVAGAEGEARALNDTETADFNAGREEIRSIDEQRKQLDEQIATFESRAAARAAAESRAAELPTTPVAGKGGAVVRAEARTYSKQTDPIGASFLRDVALRFLNADYDAAQRLARHMNEERVERGAAIERGEAEARAAGTSAFAGLVVPQYLTELVAPAAAGGRNFANICTPHPLPASGMTVNISRITTATSAAAQTENAAVSETNIDDTLLTETIFTVAGQQTLSRQAIERGTGTEDVTINDLMRRYHTALDSKLLNDATTGLTNVAQSVAYTDATPTALELYPKILNAQANLEAVMQDQSIDELYAVMHSRRWAWLQSQLGTSWPLISQPNYDAQAGGKSFGTGYAKVRGVLPNGIKVITDNNIGTTLGAGTEDEIYIVNAAELHLWEDPSAPMYIRAEQTAAASLGVLMVVYGYAAYTFRRYTNGHQKINGTGLIAPTF